LTKKIGTGYNGVRNLVKEGIRDESL